MNLKKHNVKMKKETIESGKLGCNLYIRIPTQTALLNN